jgi:hypothetical protein
MKSVKPGTVVTVSCNLDLITNPIPIPSKKVAGTYLIPGGNNRSEMIRGWMATSWAGGKSLAKKAP